jgi:hypothetical protein
MSAADGAADGGSGTGPEEPAAHRALGRIIGVGATRQGQDQTRANGAGSYRSLRHPAPSPQAFLSPTYGPDS